MLCGTLISVVLNFTDEGGSFIYFNSLYRVVFTQGQRDIDSALNLSPTVIDARANQLKPEDCFRQMLLKWFQVNEKCYLSTFIEAPKASKVQLVSLIPYVEKAIISHAKGIQKSEYKTWSLHLSIASCHYLTAKHAKLQHVNEVILDKRFESSLYCNSYFDVFTDALRADNVELSPLIPHLEETIYKYADELQENTSGQKGWQYLY